MEIGYSDGYNNHQKSIWYENNIKVVLGTIASDIGPKDRETFFSFMGISIPSSFPYVTFPKIENMIGQEIMKVSKRSMANGLKKEIKEETGKTYSEWQKSNKRIGITGSYV